MLTDPIKLQSACQAAVVPAIPFRACQTRVLWMIATQPAATDVTRTECAIAAFLAHDVLADPAVRVAGRALAAGHSVAWVRRTAGISTAAVIAALAAAAGLTTATRIDASPINAALALAARHPFTRVGRRAASVSTAAVIAALAAAACLIRAARLDALAIDTRATRVRAFAFVGVFTARVFTTGVFTARILATGVFTPRVFAARVFAAPDNAFVIHACVSSRTRRVAGASNHALAVATDVSG